MPHRLKYALAGYAILGVLATITLDGKVRIFLWLFLIALAVKSWIAAQQSN